MSSRFYRLWVLSQFGLLLCFSLYLSLAIPCHLPLHNGLSVFYRHLKSFAQHHYFRPNRFRLNSLSLEISVWYYNKSEAQEYSAPCQCFVWSINFSSRLKRIFPNHAGTPIHVVFSTHSDPHIKMNIVSYGLMTWYSLNLLWSI